MKKAVFLDRDGVMNRPVFNPLTEDYESPHYPEDLELVPWTIEALKNCRKKVICFFLYQISQVLVLLKVRQHWDILDLFMINSIIILLIMA